MASRARAITCDAGMAFVADRFEFEAVLRNVGIGGTAAGPFDVAVELGIGRRPGTGLSDKLLTAIGAEGARFRSDRSMIIGLIWG